MPAGQIEIWTREGVEGYLLHVVSWSWVDSHRSWATHYWPSEAMVSALVSVRTLLPSMDQVR